MIVSPQQHTATKRKLTMLEDALSAPRREGVPAAVAEAALAQTRELIAEMRAEIDEYETITTSDPARIVVNSIADLLVAPVRYRLASHMSAEAFARVVNVSTRQIFRYEQEGYRNCSVPNLTKILERLNIQLHGHIKVDE